MVFLVIFYIFFFLCQVYILAEGLCIYNGPSEKTVPFLGSFGLQCPKYHNPADYVLEIATGEYGNFNELLAKQCTQHTWSEKVARAPLIASANDRDHAFPYHRTSVLVNPRHELYKFGILSRRCIIQQYRDWTVTHLKVTLHIMIGILLGLLYKSAGNDASKTFSNLGFLLVSAVYLCYTSLMPAVLKFPSELSILKKENFNNWYSLKTYYAAVLMTGVPLQIWYSFVYSAPSYLLSGQPLELSRFLMFLLTLANVTVLADAVGNVIGCSVNPINGTFLGAVTTCTMLVFAGFVALFAHMAPVMRLVSHVSFLKHALEALVLAMYSYGRQPLNCPETKTYCHLKYPSEVIKEFSMQRDNYWQDIIILFVEIIILRIIAYLALKRSVKRSL